MSIEIVLIIIVAVLSLIFSKFGTSTSSSSVNSENAPISVRRWESDAKRAADKYNLPVQVILAQIWQESSGDPDAQGSAGEIGLMQLKQIAIDDLRKNGYDYFGNWQTDPAVNVMAGAAFLRLQLNRSGRLGNALKDTKSTALEAYNEGYAASKRDKGTDEYAQQVMSKAQALGYGNA